MPRERLVGLVVVQGLLPDSAADELQRLLIDVAERMNQLPGDDNRLFKFKTYPNERLLRGETPEGVRNRVFKTKRYWKVLEARKARDPEMDLLIGVCGQPLEESSFNFEETESGVGIISNIGYSQLGLIPPGLSAEAYIMYLVLCVSLLLANPGTKEHPENAGCLFDQCIELDDIRAGLKKPSLAHCRKTQLANLSDQEIRGCKAILTYIGRKQPLAILSSTIGDSAAAFIGGIAVAFLTNVVTSEWPRTAAVGVALGIVLVLYITAAKLLDRKVRTARARRISFRALSVLAVLLALACVWVIAVEKFPPLRSDSSTHR